MILKGFDLKQKIILKQMAIANQRYGAEISRIAS